LLVLGLDQQVHVAPLDAEVDDPEVITARRRERRLADRVIHAAATEVADGGDRPQHHVHWMPCMQKRPRLVWRPCARPLGRPTCAASLAAPLLEQPQLLGIPPPAPLADPLRLTPHRKHMYFAKMIHTIDFADI
jgi:hypothetical protein